MLDIDPWKRCSLNEILIHPLMKETSKLYLQKLKDAGLDTSLVKSYLLPEKKLLSSDNFALRL